MQPLSICVCSSLTLHTHPWSSASRSMFLPWILKCKVKHKPCELLMSCVPSPGLEADLSLADHCSAASSGLCSLFSLVGTCMSDKSLEQHVPWMLWGCAGRERTLPTRQSLRSHWNSCSPCFVVWLSSFSHASKHTGGHTACKGSLQELPQGLPLVWPISSEQLGTFPADGGVASKQSGYQYACASSVSGRWDLFGACWWKNALFSKQTSYLHSNASANNCVNLLQVLKCGTCSSGVHHTSKRQRRHEACLIWPQRLGLFLWKCMLMRKLFNKPPLFYCIKRVTVGAFRFWLSKLIPRSTVVLYIPLGRLGQG